MRLLWLSVILIACGAWPVTATATVFRDRAAFNAASQNLRTIDFEAPTAGFDQHPQIDGVVFRSISPAQIVTRSSSKVLLANTVGEITMLTVFLPPSTTAVGCDQFGAPMIVQNSTGESVTMNPGETTTFVGFVTDQPIETLTVFFDFPEPTVDAIIDNLSFGQRRSGNDPPVPQLLVTNDTGRIVALDSVTKESEPFRVLTSRNFSSDGHTRLTFFLTGLTLTNADLSFVTVQVEDAQHHIFNLNPEATAGVRSPTWMSQVTVRLPDELAGVGDVSVSITVRGVVSNRAQFRIQ